MRRENFSQISTAGAEMVQLLRKRDPKTSIDMFRGALFDELA